MKTYFVTNPAAFAALTLPLGAIGAVFWSQGTAGGVLLIEGVHYTVTGNTFQLANLWPEAGDRIITY